MRLTRSLAFAALLLTGTTQAVEPVVILQNPPTGGDSSFGIRQEFIASCQMPSVGECSSCMVTCPVGAAAVCKPARVAVALGDGTCQREPTCTCQSATAPAKK
jgi:hypothetical protein